MERVLARERERLKKRENVQEGRVAGRQAGIASVAVNKRGHEVAGFEVRVKYTGHNGAK